MFNCSRVSTEKLGGMEKFDIAITMSVLHHLNDDEAIDLFRLARSTLVEGGRLATMDPCYVDGQSRAARYIISRDRGLNVRSEDGYRTLAEQVFERVNVTIRHDLQFTPPPTASLIAAPEPEPTYMAVVGLALAEPEQSPRELIVKYTDKQTYFVSM
jgi:hypothetical protein